MRKLASLQSVLALHPIPNADFIELAQINGWQCVVKKGDFQVGDVGVYFEIDAIPPDTPLFGFLIKGMDARPKSFRIRTMRLRGCLSQGLLMPLKDFPEVAGLQEGDDCTALLGVEKYEPPPPNGMGEYGGPFSHRVSKTDEMRAQSMPSLLDELRGLPYHITEKCDGTSSTFTFEDGRFHVYGRQHEIAEGDNIFWEVASLYGLASIMEMHPNLALQCEIVGVGIQGNPMGLKGHEIRAFDLYDKSTCQYVAQDILQSFCEVWGIPAARLLKSGESFDLTLQELLVMAEGRYEGTHKEREGIVVRPIKPQHSMLLGKRLSFKVISNLYLLKGGN